MVLLSLYVIVSFCACLYICLSIPVRVSLSVCLSVCARFCCLSVCLSARQSCLLESHHVMEAHVWGCQDLYTHTRKKKKKSKNICICFSTRLTSHIFNDILLTCYAIQKRHMPHKNVTLFCFTCQEEKSNQLVVKQFLALKPLGT